MMKKKFNRLLLNSSFYFSRTKCRSHIFFKGKYVFLRKGFYWRKLFLNDIRLNYNLGNYLVSRKPFKRINKLNRKR